MRRFVAILVGWTVATCGPLVPAAPGEPWAISYVTFAFLAPVAVFALAYRTAPRFRSVVLMLDLGAVTAVQGMRIAGIAMLALWAAGAMTPAFALWAGGLDVVVGLTAVPLAYLVVARRPLPRARLRAWHAMGLLDFVVALPLGLLSTSWLGSAAGATTDEMFRLPMAFIPAVGVPFMIIMHVTALLQLRDGRTPVAAPLLEARPGSEAPRTVQDRLS